MLMICSDDLGHQQISARSNCCNCQLSNCHIIESFSTGGSSPHAGTTLTISSEISLIALIALIALNALIVLIALIALIDLIGLIALIGLIVLIALIALIALNP